MPGIEQIEGVGCLHYVLVGGQRQLPLCQPHRFALTELKLGKQVVDIGFNKVKGRHFHFVLVVHIAVGDGPGRGVCPDEVIDRLDALQVHRDALQTVGQLTSDGVALQPTCLLKVGELADFHAVQPHLPTQTPCAQSG